MTLAARTLPLLGALALSGSAHAGSAHADPALLEAETLALKDGIATGEGAVRVTFQDQVAYGQRFTYDLRSGLLIIEDGAWTRPEGALSFQRAEIEVGDGTGLALEGRYEGRDGRLKIEGDRLTWASERTLEGEGVSFTTCTCERPAWSVSAREVRVTLDEVATFRGAWISICEQPVLPVPAGRLSLSDRKSGLLAPSLGFGEDGLVLAQPLYLTLGPAADLTLSPELRSARSARLLTELRYALADGRGATRAVGGWDWESAAARGALDVQHQQRAGRASLGVDALWWSDLDYGADYGDSWFSRSAPWTEARALAAWGPLALESDSFQTEESMAQRPVAAAFRGVGALGPVAAQAEARLDGLTEGASLGASSGLSPRALGRASAAWGADLDVLRGRARAGALAVAYPGAAPWAQGWSRLDVAVPLWGATARALWTFDLGADALISRTVGTVSPRLADEAPQPAWSAGPTLRATATTAAGVPLSATLAAPWTPDGLRPQGELRLRHGPWLAEGYADLDVQELALARDDGTLALGVGGARAEELAQGRMNAGFTLPGKASAWRPSASALLDLDGLDLVSLGLGLRLRPACDCVQAEVTAAISQDRALPDLGFKLEIW